MESSCTNKRAREDESTSASHPALRHTNAPGEPDLKVILSTGPDEQVVTAYSQVLMLQSDYVKGELMRFNHTERMTIRFPDVNRSLWDKAMKYANNPMEVIKLIEFDFHSPIHTTFADQFADDVPEVLPFYQQYSFESVLEACDVCIHHGFWTAFYPVQKLI